MIPFARGRSRLPGPVRPPEPRPDPSAARRLLRQLSRPLRAYARAWRRVRPTREGGVFVVTGLAVALAALNTGNNLLYLVFAAMLSLVVLSGVLSESSLRGLRVERRFDERLFACRPARGTWQLTSRRRWLPNLTIDLEEVPGPHAVLVDRGEVTVPYLGPGGEERRAGRWTFGCRGVHRLRGVKVSTTWPFGILRKWSEVSVPIDVLVYPEPGPTSAELVAVSGPQGNGIHRPRRGATGEMRGLRDHRHGEDLRAVHWRTSARLRRRVAVERDSEVARRVEVRVPVPPAGLPLRRRLETFEAAVSGATTAVLDAAEHGSPVVLRLPSEVLEGGDGPEATDQLLVRLATVRLPGAL